MKKISIYRYIDYIKYIKDVLKANKSTYGLKAKLAQSAGCQRSHLSLILKNSANLTPEQALGITKVFSFNTDEAKFFLLLVQHARAGTKDLKGMLELQISEILQNRENLSIRIKDKIVVPESQGAFLYSSWEHLALVIAVSIPNLRRSSQLAQHLGLKQEYIEKALDQLEEFDLVSKKGSEWFIKNSNIHLPKDSPFNSLNHSNWRQKAVQNAFLKTDDLHYTSVCSLSKESVNNVKQLLLELIDKSRNIVGNSKEEELYCLTCDWFKV